LRDNLAVPVNGTFPTAGPYIEDDTESLGIPLDQVPIYRQLLSYVARTSPESLGRADAGRHDGGAVDVVGRPRGGAGRYGTIDPCSHRVPSRCS